ncbi:MAG: thioredoxin domain-containing protein [Acidobacteria bacterium]|nr:thioredoxin domain-containing protein [Acidobacteriota bacterium]
MRMFLTCAVLLALACSAPAQQVPAAQSTAAPGESDVAAEIGDRTITVRELDDRWQQTDPGSRAQAVQQLYDGRKQALDAIIAEMLIAEAAAEQDIEADAFTGAEIARRTAPVADGQVLAFFQANQAEMQGRGMDVMGPLIRQYLEEQARNSAYDMLVAELRAEGPPFRLVLDAPRQQIELAADDPIQGNASAMVTLVEYSDFQCPFCAQVMPTLKRVQQTYGDRVRIVWKNFPLTAIHPQAFGAAQAGRCAQEQGKFWELHDRLFANQQALQPESLKAHAVAVGLDAAAFDTCLDSGKHADAVQAEMDVATALGVVSTPTVFINGRLVSGAQPYDVFAKIIDEELARAGQP